MTRYPKAQSKLFTIAQVRRWRREYDRIGKVIATLEQERAILKNMIDGANVLASKAEHQEQRRTRMRPRRPIKKHARSKPIVPAARQAASETTLESAPPRREAGSWTSVIRSIVYSADRPWPYGDVKNEIMKTQLADRLRRSEKGFYGAISKLANAKEIVRHKAHIFSPAAFQKFKENLDAGLVKDLKIPNPAHYSPMGEAIKAMMRTRSHGAASGHILWELRKDPKFAEAIDRNKSHPYNVLGRLVKTGDLIKRGKRYYSPEAQNKAPSEPTSKGASQVTGEGDASPNESQGRLLG